MDKIRLATVGTGYFSQFHYEAWHRIEQVQLVSVCSYDIDAGQHMADKYSVTNVYSDFAEMMVSEKPDLVDIITPPETHLEYIKIAVAHNVAIICQKPFCRNLDEAKIAVQLAEDAGVLLVVHENFRFQPWYGAIKEQLEQQELGNIFQAHFRFRPGDGQGPHAYLERQPYFQEMEQFLIHETGIHWIDTFRFLFGEMTTVFARLRTLNPVISGEDSGILIFEFESGVQAIFDGNRLIDHVAKNRRLTMGEMMIEGEQGVIQLTGDAAVLCREHNSNSWLEYDYQWNDQGFGGDCVYRLQQHVIDHLLGLGPVYNVASEYLRNMYIERAIYESAKKGQVITL